MKPIELAPAARADLHDIALYIAEESPDRAESFVAELEARFAVIGERPLSFPARDDVSPGLRSAPHGRYRILFRDLAHTVRVVRILHSARDALAIARDDGFR